MSAKPTPRARVEELLVDRALQGLSEEERTELAALLVEGGDATDDDSFDRAVAAVGMATAGRLGPLPASLASRIEADALRALANDGSPRMRSASFVRVTAPMARGGPEVSVATSRIGRGDPFRIAGWVAAAACLALAVAGWRRPAQPSTPPPPMPTVAQATAPPVPPKTPAPAVLRERLLAAVDAVRLDWSPTKDATARDATGDVVWSSAQQTGFMRFHGLAANDPTTYEYQLWIFDPSQDTKTPIDGGVFDVDRSTGDVVVPVTPKLHVTGPTLFAVTIEKPGGVVVSGRKRIVLTAAVKT